MRKRGFRGWVAPWDLSMILFPFKIDLMGFVSRRQNYRAENTKKVMKNGQICFHEISCDFETNRPIDLASGQRTILSVLFVKRKERALTLHIIS